jgi:hypothetical protein
MKIETHQTQHYDLKDLTRAELTTIHDALESYYGSHPKDDIALRLANTFYGALWPDPPAD